MAQLFATIAAPSRDEYANYTVKKENHKEKYRSRKKRFNVDKQQEEKYNRIK